MLIVLERVHPWGVLLQIKGILKLESGRPRFKFVLEAACTSEARHRKHESMLEMFGILGIILQPPIIFSSRVAGTSNASLYTWLCRWQ